MLKYRMMGSKSLTYNHFRRNLNFGSYFLTSVGRDSSRPAGVSVIAYNQFIFRSVMRKVFMFASAAIAALAMVSCNKEIETPESLAGEACPEGYYVEELEATYPVDPATRTAFNEDSGKFAWTEGDELAFHLSNGTYTSAPIDPATSKVKLYLPVGVTRDNYAVYPASAVVDEAAEIGNMQVTLPSTYDISGNLTTDYVPMPLIATNDANNKKLKFEHVGGLLQVNLNVPAGVKTATLSMGKTITGTFDLAAGSGNGVIKAGAASDDALTFVLSEEGLADATTVKLLAPLPSGTYEKFEVKYSNGFTFTKDLSSKPWEFDRTQGKKVSIAEDSFEDTRNYFWFEALEAGSTVSIAFNYSLTESNAEAKYPYQYSFDKKTWTDYDLQSINENKTITLENIGDRVYFRGQCDYSIGGGNSYNNEVGRSSYGSNPRYGYFKGSGSLKVGGELLTLKKYDEDDYLSYHATSDSDFSLNLGSLRGCYGYLFQNMTCLVDASELILPDFCFSNMYVNTFSGCTGLVKAPVLPAMDLKEYAYSSMFEGCTSLVEAPELPATNLNAFCYAGMFRGCTSLVDAYDLPATDLYDWCYNMMFYGCTSLKRAPSFVCERFVGGNPQRHFNMMFYGCSGLETAPSIYINPDGGKASAYMCYETFQNCSNLTDASNVVIGVSSVTVRTFEGTFANCIKLEYGPVFEKPLVTHVGKYYASDQRMMKSDNVYCFGMMFYRCSSLKSWPVGLEFSEDMTVTSTMCSNMFNNCSSLSENIPDILRPNNVASQCYYNMFSGCVSMTKAPELPATEMANSCYYGMFSGCSLVDVPDRLPAMSLAESCYANMFSNCKSSSFEAPELPATELANNCYFGMFAGSSLTKAPFLPATTLARSCYGAMFSNCTSLQEVSVNFTEWPDDSDSTVDNYRSTWYWMEYTPRNASCKFIKPEALPIENNNNHRIPSGWTVYNLEDIETGI